jgi:hypothetical protein
MRTPFIKVVTDQGVALLKTAANNKAIVKVRDKFVQQAAAAAVGYATRDAGAAIGRGRAKLSDRRYVRDLARQVGGSYSYDVIIGSGRYCVVWKGNVPYRVVPDLPEGTGPWEELPDLQNFCGVRHEPRSRRKS